MFIFSGRTNKELAAIRQLLEQVNNKVDQVEEQELKIMSQITDWAAAEQADLSTIQATLNGIVTGISTTAPGAPTPAPVASASNKRMGNVG